MFFHYDLRSRSLAENVLFLDIHPKPHCGILASSAICLRLRSLRFHRCLSLGFFVNFAQCSSSCIVDSLVCCSWDIGFVPWRNFAFLNFFLLPTFFSLLLIVSFFFNLISYCLQFGSPHTQMWMFFICATLLRQSSWSKREGDCMANIPIRYSSGDRFRWNRW